ncbi:hypothetical protein AN189_18235 [Loktanella sp. 3ANDIMAR09]|nr:hypothetical protein AN189_18235 [Loktanella sp. 3ANDIMAR09]
MLGEFETATQIDAEIQRSAIQVLHEGAELLFERDALIAVFLYLTAGPGNLGVFRGTTDLLGKEIIEGQNEEKFIASLEAQGFWAPKRSYPFSIDRLNESLRIRWEKRKGQVLVLIDDGARIR